VADDVNSVRADATAIETAGVVDAVERPTQSKWFLWRKGGKALASYLLDSEVHTFAFSVAANAIISFIPFVVLLYTVALSVFHSQVMKGVVDNMVNYFLPSATRDPKWVVDNIVKEAVLPLLKRHGVQVFSLVMILISCTGIFLPLEVALNQAWGVTKSRNYLLNQTVAFGLAILMVALAVVSMIVNVSAQNVLTFLSFHQGDNVVIKFFVNGINFICLAVTTGAAVILFLFSVYFVLPNRKVPWRPVLRTATITGIVLLIARFIFAAVLPHLDLQSLYGPFFVSVGLLFWAYISGLIMFAGAQFSVAKWGQITGGKN
jgi:YihY family inner membrane protein